MYACVYVCLYVCMCCTLYSSRGRGSEEGEWAGGASLQYSTAWVFMFLLLRRLLLLLLLAVVAAPGHASYRLLVGVSSATQLSELTFYQKLVHKTVCGSQVGSLPTRLEWETTALWTPAGPFPRRHQDLAAGKEQDAAVAVAAAAVVAATADRDVGQDVQLRGQEVGWRKRWTVVGLCFVAFVLCNLDRVNMSIAILPMAEQFGWSTTTMGLVQSSFFWGYLLTQILGGVLADRWGGKSVLGFGVLWWSLATAATPAAAQAGLPALLLARCMMGIGEGVALPAMNSMLVKWVPAEERSRSLALVYSGMFTGSVLGLGASPQVLAAFGWPAVFWSFGSLGVLWYFIWQGSVTSAPSDDASTNLTELATMDSNTLSPENGSSTTAATAAAAAAGGSAASVVVPEGGQAGFDSSSFGGVPWSLLLSRKEVWALILCHFCHNWGLFILLTWMPAYYNQVLGLNLMQSGVLSVLPWVAMAVMANVAGWAADALVARGTSITVVRKDIGPRYAGVLLGLSNTAGVLAGVLGSLVTGWLLQPGGVGDAAVGGWSQVWAVAVVLYLSVSQSTCSASASASACMSYVWKAAVRLFFRCGISLLFRFFVSELGSCFFRDLCFSVGAIVPVPRSGYSPDDLKDFEVFTGFEVSGGC
ncbi:hypothetical protein VOLCADRAFT_105756 [Volvox carteri f. nagariensis]|uniref:Major facilitator superfamily (MFS) profile domain-containing protein n=1 Tax=Volvox carteri f. nagariensis TaxID=3068 RepID=D8U2V1_VOLCA|nr:uncharacterized protein VOLCADRAFT_105756 [Volvox carteri f. nagariensis]EFJ45872.1 hypothetical protein VOLCADRAFT_105756 [Volvox carteri f. nagariensis]|eukprot:XP_002952950.1 hypothetical protein VOLCADRAFT_105756 [Volvox carteri f. nagariensis]